VAKNVGIPWLVGVDGCIHGRIANVEFSLAGCVYECWFSAPHTKPNFCVSKVDYPALGLLQKQTQLLGLIAYQPKPERLLFYGLVTRLSPISAFQR
jgi:hypothetical protein